MLKTHALEAERAVPRAISGTTGTVRYGTGAVCSAALILGDACALTLSMLVADGIRDLLRGPMVPPPWMMEAGAVWVVLRAAAGMYPAFGVSGAQELRTSTVTAGLGALNHTLILFALQEVHVSRLSAIATWLLVAVLGWFVRGAVKHVLVRGGWYRCPLVVVGAGRTGALLVREMRANAGLGLHPVAFVDDDPRKQGAEVVGVPVLGPTTAAVDGALPPSVRHAVIAMPELGARETAGLVETLSRRYRHISIVPDLVGIGNLWVNPRALGRYLTVEVQNNLADPVSIITKRAFDLALGIPLLILAAPIIAAAALAVKAVSPGSAFYFQDREGQGGRRIRVWKIRTMVPDAEARLASTLAQDPAARAEWHRYMKLRNDPRVIPTLGRLLRQSSLDELPQLWNVVRGEMSLVGPRPFPDYHLERFPKDFRALRRQVRPGMTGLWQVTSRSEGDLRAQQDADAYYIRNWSVWMDLWVILRTPAAVLSRKGAR